MYPGSLNAELLEKGRGNYTIVGGERVGIQQEPTNDGHDDDGDAAAKYLTEVANEGASHHGPNIGNDLPNLVWNTTGFASVQST